MVTEAKKGEETGKEDPPVEPTVTDDGAGKKEEKPTDETPPFDTKAFAEEIVTAVSEETSKEVDRRITGLMKTLTSEYDLKKQTPKDDPPKEPSRSVGNQRILRAAIRDRVAMEWEDVDERKMASDLAKQIGEARGLSDTEDEELVASEVVEQVKTWMETAKEQYEAATKSDLERRGLLKDQPPGQQQSGKKGEQGPSAQEQFDKGAEKAKEMFGQKE